MLVCVLCLSATADSLCSFTALLCRSFLLGYLSMNLLSVPLSVTLNLFFFFSLVIPDCCVR